MIDEIIENFSLLDEWDDRYRYVIELGRSMSPLSETDRIEANKVQGCASQVWLATTIWFDHGHPVLGFSGDSDAHIVRGLVAILLAVVSGKRASDILAIDPIACLIAWACANTSRRSVRTGFARWSRASKPTQGGRLQSRPDARQDQHGGRSAPGARRSPSRGLA